MRYPIYLFDLDGTVLDTADMIVESMQHTVLHHFGTSPTRERLVAGIGTPLDEQLKHHAHDAGRTVYAAEEVAEWEQTYRTHNHAIHDARVRAFPKVEQTLDALIDAGARLAIVTSKPLDIASRGLELTGLASRFEFVIGCYCVRHPKPDPEPVHLALSRMDATADQAVFIGDSPHDLKAGRAAGVDTCAALWGPFAPEALHAEAPTYALHHFDDLLKL